MRIIIKKMQVEMRLGVHDWERRAAQSVYVTIALEYDSGPATRTDRIEQALDYDRVAGMTREVLEQRHFDLIETASESLLDALMTLEIDYARVELEKPNAIPAAQGVTAVTERRRVRPASA